MFADPEYVWTTASGTWDIKMALIRRKDQSAMISLQRPTSNLKKWRQVTNGENTSRTQTIIIIRIVIMQIHPRRMIFIQIDTLCYAISLSD